MLNEVKHLSAYQRDFLELFRSLNMTMFTRSSVGIHGISSTPRVFEQIEIFFRPAQVAGPQMLGGIDAYPTYVRAAADRHAAAGSLWIDPCGSTTDCASRVRAHGSGCTNRRGGRANRCGSANRCGGRADSNGRANRCGG
jgi:hypothetical protein